MPEKHNGFLGGYFAHYLLGRIKKITKILHQKYEAYFWREVVSGQINAQGS